MQGKVLCITKHFWELILGWKYGDKTTDFFLEDIEYYTITKDNILGENRI